MCGLFGVLLSVLLLVCDGFGFVVTLIGDPDRKALLSCILSLSSSLSVLVLLSSLLSVFASSAS